MSDAFIKSRESCPPADLEAEKRFLGALLVAEQHDRNQATLLVKPDAFHDPWHEWLFRALRQARRCSITSELLYFIAKEVDRPDWIGKNFTIWVSELLIQRDGSSCCGQARLLRMYAEQINHIHRRRERINELESELLTLIFDPPECQSYDGANV